MPASSRLTDLLALSLVSAAACSEADGDEMTGTAEVSSSSQTGGEPACDGRCVSLPTDWEGPVIAELGSSPAPCPPDSTELLLGEAGPIEAPAATCAPCACGAPTVTCAPAMVELFGANDCSVEKNATFRAVPDACTQFSSTDMDGFLALPIPVASASCPPAGGEATVAGPTTAGAARICEPEAPLPCANGACIAESLSICVWKTGDVACPSDFPGRTVVFDGLEDGRGCSPCGCTTPPASCEGLSTVYYAEPDCTGVSFMNPHNGICTPTGLDVVNASMILTLTTTVGDCQPEGGEPTGSVQPSGPRTVCCEP